MSIHLHEITGTFRPLHDWVVLRPISATRIKKGVHLPDVRHEYGRCEVMAVGPGFRPFRDGVYGPAVIPTDLKVGQFVFVQRFVEGEMKLKLNGQTVFLIRERHLNVTIEGEFLDDETALPAAVKRRKAA